MRIVHVAPFYPPVIGGVEKVVRRVAEYMAFKGEEVYVLTYNRARTGSVGSLPHEEIINNVHVIRLKPDITWSHGTYSAEFSEILRRLRPDFVHVHVWRHPHVFQVAKLKERLGFKAVLHGHAPLYNLKQVGFVTWTYHRIVDLVKKGALRTYDLIVSLTPCEKRVLVWKLDVEEEKVIVIPNGIDDCLLEAAKDSKISNNTDAIALYIGRLSREKNVDLLVEAMHYVAEKIQNAKLVLAGPDEGIWGRLMRRQEMGTVEYVGPVNEETKIKLYIAASIFADPSSYEGFGIALLEAQAFGKPCVITGEGGQEYAAPPGKTSLYAKSNPKDFGEAISLLLSDKELYKKLSSNTRKWASLHSWSKILPKYNEVYS